MEDDLPFPIKSEGLAREFAEKFPDDLVAHFFLSTISFWLGRYEEAAVEGSRAFNKSETPEDMLSSAIVAGSSYYQLGKYEQGMDILRHAENRKSNEDLERLMFAFSMAMKNEKEAVMHLNELHRMNKKAAEDLLVRYIE